MIDGLLSFSVLSRIHSISTHNHKVYCETERNWDEIYLNFNAVYEMLIYSGKNRTAYLEALKLLTDGVVSSESKETVMPSGNDAGSPTIAEDRWVTRWNLAGLHRTGPDDSRKSSLPANDAKQEDKQPHDVLPREDFNPLAKYVYIISNCILSGFVIFFL